MRVLHVIGSLDPVFGGPPLAAASLAVAQAALGAQVQVLSYDSPGSTGNALHELPGAERVTVTFVPRKSRLSRITGIDSRPFCRSIGSSADFVHLHGVWEGLLRVAGSAARRAGVAYAVTPHGMLDPWSLRQSALRKQLALRLGYRAMLRDAAFIHCLNEEERKLIEPLGLRNRTEVIPNGIFREQFAAPVLPQALEAALPGLNGRPYILFLSRLHHKKGLDYLADAFAQFARQNARTQLVVAGPDDGALDGFERQINNAGLTQRVHVPGPLYGAAKHAALAQAAVFCLPSRQEGFSIAIIEALSCGVPCVISEACHFPQVQARGAGCVVPLTADAIAAALLNVVKDQATRSAMSRAALELSAGYTWPAIAQSMLAAYQSAVDARAVVS